MLPYGFSTCFCLLLVGALIIVLLLRDRRGRLCASQISQDRAHSRLDDRAR